MIPSEFTQACQEHQWTRDTSTSHRSETNAIAERAVRKGKEGTAATLAQSGLPDEQWNEAMDYLCQLRNVSDGMAGF